MTFLIAILYFLTFIVPILLGIAFFTLAERKVMGTIQRRKGPNSVGFGILQPIADGLKLLIKEATAPTAVNFFTFIVAPLITITLSIFSWVIIPFNHAYIIADINLSIFFFLAASSLSIYGLIFAGWASNSKYAFLGALRGVAQMLSYEISLGLVILPIVVLTGSLNFYDIIFFQIDSIWFIIPLYPSFFLFFIIMLAETNRAPFDLPEAEAELIAGYNLEYGSIYFAFFFLGEYNNILLNSAVQVILFWGGFSVPFITKFTTNFFFISILESFFFSFKIVCICFLFIVVRALLPRYRYDHLMQVGWKVLLPLALSFFLFITGLIISFQGLPL